MPTNDYDVIVSTDFEGANPQTSASTAPPSRGR
jgi:hypothetical protein